MLTVESGKMGKFGKNRGIGLRNRISKRIREILAASSAVIVVALYVGILQQYFFPTAPKLRDSTATSIQLSSGSFHLPVSALLTGTRRLYAYSVIPGGVESTQDLLAAFSHSVAKER